MFCQLRTAVTYFFPWAIVHEAADVTIVCIFRLNQVIPYVIIQYLALLEVALQCVYEILLLKVLSFVSISIFNIIGCQSVIVFLSFYGS